MKAHIGVDVDSGVTHSLETATAKLHHSQVRDDLLHDEETPVRADKRYVSAERAAAFKAPDKVWGVMRKASAGSDLHPVDGRINRIIAMVRARVEDPYWIIKRPFDHKKTRYRGLAANRAQLFPLFALTNQLPVRRMLMARGRDCPKPGKGPLGRRGKHETSRRRPYQRVQEDHAAISAMPEPWIRCS